MRLTVLMVLTADAVHPLHEDAVCRHQLPSYDCAGVPPCVHASVPPCWRGGPRCACCGCNRAAAGFQGGLCCGPLLWHLCGLQTVSAAPLLGAVSGEPPCLSFSHWLAFISFSLPFNCTLNAFRSFETFVASRLCQLHPSLVQSLVSHLACRSHTLCLLSHAHCPSIAHSLSFISQSLPFISHLLPFILHSLPSTSCFLQISSQHPLPMLLFLITQHTVTDSLTSMFYS